MTIRELCHQLAGAGLRMPIGTDLVLHEQADPEAILTDAEALGRVVEMSARRWRTPLAVPLMDLRLEKADLLAPYGVGQEESDAYQFDSAPEERLNTGAFSRRNQANIDAIRYIAERTDLVPVGMAIGPFSLMTKLVRDPITGVAMAGMGVTADEDANVKLVETALRLAETAVHRSLRAQIAAGARAVLVCEPAANRVYISPKQLERGSDVFERFVMEPDLRMARVIAEAGAELIFHDCGELTTFMVEQFATRLHPAMLSLGGSRALWEDAAVVPKDVVLYGNLPTKNFYSDAAMPVERVEAMTRELREKMREARHPHILGSECDVLHVPEAAATIRAKVDCMLTA